MSENEKMQSDTVGKLFEALSKAQGEIESALKDKKNPFYKSNYADLASVWEACREPLSKNGLCILQTIAGTKSDAYLITTLGHSSGEWIKSNLPLYVVKQDPQGMGSAMTYARRYALSAIVGICQEDDDGNRAVKSLEKEKKEESSVKKQIITVELEDELKSLLLENLTLKSIVDEFLGKRGATELSQLSYDEFIKILNRARKEKGGS